MVGITPLELDDICPEDLDIEVKENAGYAALIEKRRAMLGADVVEYVPRWRNRRERALGVNPVNLYDWRHLEARSNVIKTRYSEFSNALWELITDIAKLVKSEGSAEAWIVDPRQPEHVVVIYVDRATTIGSRSIKQIVKIGTGDPDYKGLLIKGELADAYLHLRERTDTWRTRWRAYFTAFHRAVEERLRFVVRTKLLQQHPDHYFHTPGIFLIENYGRHYLVTSNEQGTLKWSEGQIFNVN